MTHSALATDGYKLSMAEAGWPLRPETFYYSHRRGGPQLLPFDPEALVGGLLPEPAADDYAFLARCGYEVGAGFKAAMGGALTVRGLAKGSWFLPREPVFSLTGPSALVSWLEPLLLQAHLRIQVATMAKLDPEGLARAVAVVTCERERELIAETLDAIGVAAPAMRVDAESYARGVGVRAAELVSIVGSGARVFEVGLRAASCPEQHLIALRAVRDAGIERTSHVEGARALGMIPVGTMGHEHVQRFGSDREAFRAIRDRRPGRASYLLDTFDTVASGIPAALDLIAADPSRGDQVRYDSGDQEAQLRLVHELGLRRGLRPIHILEDGYDAARTRTMESLRARLGIAAEEVFYGYGGYLVGNPASGLTRDRVAAVYKLSATDRLPVMKFAKAGGSDKRSVPGEPVVFRRTGANGPLGLVGQHGETPPDGYERLTGQSAIIDISKSTDITVLSSKATAELEQICERRIQL